MDTIHYIQTAINMFEASERQRDRGLNDIALYDVQLSIASALIAIAGSLNSIDGNVDSLTSLEQMKQGI